MNSADRVPEPDVRRALDEVRARDDAPEVDDELLAAFVEGGIGAIPEHSRAAVLRAVGRHPGVAAAVAALRTSVEPAALRIAPFGIPRAVWRSAWAACTLLTLGLTAWALTSASPGAGEAALLDGAAATVQAESFREWFEGRPLQYTIVVLWLVMCLLAIPSTVSAQARSDVDARRRGSA
jgi:hypothetical protein